MGFLCVPMTPSQVCSETEVYPPERSCGGGTSEHKHPDGTTGFCILKPISKLYLTEVKQLLKSISIKIFLKTIVDLDIQVVPWIGL